jgi:YegS/Rv2252/BmrU family lipid kinase
MTSVAVVAHRDKLTTSTAGDLKSALAKAGLADSLWLEVAKGSAAESAARDAIKDGAETIIVCGGDGTVRAAAAAIADTECALAVVPAGTANLFATGLDLPSEPQEIVELVIRGDRRTIDTGVCNGLRFAVMGGTGLDAAMIAQADDQKDSLGTWAYVKAGVKEARTSKSAKAKITVDGSLFFEGDVTCVLVGNLGRLKGGFIAFPDASPTDGVLDIAVLTASGLREWASVMVSAVRHKQETSSHVHIGSGTKIKVRLDKKQRFELDGGSKGRTRKLDFRVAPSSLIVCAPVTAS